MRDTPVEYGIGDILVMKQGLLSIKPEMIDCDMYRMIDGDPAAVASRIRTLTTLRYSALGLTCRNSRVRASCSSSN